LGFAADHLRANATAYGIDPTNLALFAWSGHATRGLAVAMDPRRTELKVAVIYYGIGPVTSLRLDLPTPFVRGPGSDPAQRGARFSDCTRPRRECSNQRDQLRRWAPWLRCLQ
jgi:hypothetical protein